MSRTARTFRLADEIGAGLSCDERGVFLGATPLLAHDPALGWRPRPLDELNAEGAAGYGLPVDFAGKLPCLRAVAAALDRGEIALAKIAALQLRLPNPPPLAKGLLAPAALAELVYALEASNLLAKEFDPDKHPRWPAGAPDHQGGQFAPAGEGEAATDTSFGPHETSPETGGGRAERAGNEKPEGLTNAGFLGPLPHLPMDAENQNVANAIDSLRSGDGSRSVKLGSYTLVLTRTGTTVSVEIQGVYALRGTYIDPPGVSGIDIHNVQMKSESPAFGVTVRPNGPGAPTELNAEIRVVPTVVGHDAKGTAILRSAVNIAYDHDVTVSIGGVPVLPYKKGHFYYL